MSKMITDTAPKLNIAISSRALFDLDESNTIYEEYGVKAYSEYQIAHENNVLALGVAFPLVKKLLDLNQYGHYVEVILLSRNSADTGLRVFNSIQHYGLNITRAVFTSGQAPYNYAPAFKSHLFLSANPEDVRGALSSGFAAAHIFTAKNHSLDNHSKQLRLAFDGDAVLFSDESERIYHEHGIEAFFANEKATAQQPLSAGPLKSFLMALHNLQHILPIGEECPIRTALVTARSAPAHERVIRTFREWGIRIDEALFLGGLEKGEFLKAFNADIFFDDQRNNCEQASLHVPTGHIPNGIKNLVE